MAPNSPLSMLCLWTCRLRKVMRHSCIIPTHRLRAFPASDTYLDARKSSLTCHGLDLAVHWITMLGGHFLDYLTTTDPAI